MNDNFFQESEYELPVTSNYLKFQEGENTFRVLSSAITGFEYWNTSGKPVRARSAWDELPNDIRVSKEEIPRINHFWAFVVWNYDAKRIQILELTQKGIMKAMQAYIKNPRWGHPKGYDITVTRSGSGFDTEYFVTANPHSPIETSIADKYSKMKINLEALFEGNDPFGK